MQKRFSKKGLSPIIAIVLILIVTFVAISIVAVFVVPFVNQSLEGSEECFGVLGSVSFDETIYNCNIDDGAGKERTGFSIRVDGDEVVGLKVGIFASGSSDVVDIMDPVVEQTIGSDLTPNIQLLNDATPNDDENGNGNNDDDYYYLIIPAKGGVRTYFAEGIFDKFEVSSILKSGKICNVGDNIEVSQCIDNQAISDLLAH